MLTVIYSFNARNNRISMHRVNKVKIGSEKIKRQFVTVTMAIVWERSSCCTAKMFGDYLDVAADILTYL